MKKKLTKTLALGLSLAAALTLTTGCGKKEDTTSDTSAPAVTSESSSDNSGSETAAGTIDYTICPWAFRRRDIGIARGCRSVRNDIPGYDGYAF